MKRTAEAQASKTAQPEVGEVDLMSKLAAGADLPLCKRIGWHLPHQAGEAPTCARAQGHDEALPEHPGAKHVAVGRRYVIVAVWR